VKNSILLISAFLFFCFTALADNSKAYKLPDLRVQFLEASKDSKAGKEFHELMSNYEDNNPVVLAYKAVSEAIMAKHIWNPYFKMKHLQQSAEIFEQAVKLDASNPEIRFLRFTVEHYVPRYLNMSKNLQEDKAKVISGLQRHPNSGLSTDMARNIRDFLLTKDHCTEQEKQKLKSIPI
jgi:tetratricopeptide (TPR) repeat protein